MLRACKYVNIDDDDSQQRARKPQKSKIKMQYDVVYI